MPNVLLHLKFCIHIIQVDRVRKNESLSAAEKHLLIHEKRDTIVKPLIHTIERLSEITNKAAETAHEQWFQETYGQLIARGLAKLKKPLKDEDLASDWQPFKQVNINFDRGSKSSLILPAWYIREIFTGLFDDYCVHLTTFDCYSHPCIFVRCFILLLIISAT